MAELGYQFTVDCADPDALADFWSQALGVPRDRHAGPEGTYAALRHPAGGPGSRIVFQRVPEPKTGKARAHLDVLCGADRREAEVRRIVGLGASLLREVDEPMGRWTVLTDPEGNEFCVG